MTMLVRPGRFRMGADTAIGLYLGDEQRGLAFDFTVMEMVVRDDDAPSGSFYGNPNSLLTYTAPSPKMIWNAAGVLTSGSNMRIDHHPVTHVPLGLSIEEQRVNVVLHNRDMSNAAWVKTNVTAVKDQTGPDGVVNSASSLLATAANGTCLQAITLASVARFQTAYVKRLTGSGTIQMTMDNGTTWTTVTVTADWTRASIPTQTLANPTVGFRIVTSGDKIAVDLVQNEGGAYATSPIAVTTVAVTRNRDDISLSGASLPLTPSFGTALVEFIPGGVNHSNIGVFNLGNTPSNDQSRIHIYYANADVLSFLNTAAATGAASFPFSAILATGVTEKVALAWTDNDFAACNAGGTVLTDTVGTAPSNYNKLYLHGTWYQASGTWHLRRLKILNRRASNAELQAMTV